MANVVPIFSTPIYFDDIVISNSEKDYCKQIAKTRNTQYNFNITDVHNVIDSPQLARVRAEAMQHVDLYTNDVLSINQDQFEFVINTSWSIDMDYNTNVDPHIHSHSLFTAVIIIDCSSKSRIYFSMNHNPLVHDFFCFDYNRYNTYNSRTWFFDVVPNQIYIFPSAILHYAKCMEEEGTMSVLAFDVFIKGILGSHVSTINFN